MSKINQKLILEKILLKDLFFEDINLLNEADPPATGTATDDKKPEQPKPQVAPIADEIAPLLQNIKTADSNMKKAENEFINIINNALNRVKATDKQDPEIRSTAIIGIKNKITTGLTQNKNLYYKNLAARDSSMLTIINLLNARYEELTGGKKLPALNPNKILPGLMAAKAAGQAVPSAPSIGSTAAVGSTGTSAAGSTSGTIREHRDLLKSAIKLLILESTLPVPFSFEHFKKLFASKRDVKKKRETAIEYAFDFLKELGTGSSRKALLLPDGKGVLKLAINKAGIAQNKQELQIYNNPSIAKIYTDLYEWDRTGMWLLTEYVQPFRTGEEFAEAIGVPKYSAFRNIIHDFEEYNEKDLQSLRKKYVDRLDKQEKKFLNSWNELEKSLAAATLAGEKYAIERDMLILEFNYKEDKAAIEAWIRNLDNVSSNPEAYNFITRIFSLMQRGLLAGDIDWKHFGRDANGEIKLYDYGFSLDVWKKFYKR